MPRRTKKIHAELKDNPELLFGSGTRTCLWPNGRHEMWVENAARTMGFRIVVNDGPAGFSLQVDAVNLLRRDMDVFVADEHVQTDGIGGVSIVQYRKDERSQAFRQAYIERDTEMLARLISREEEEDHDQNS